MRVMCNKLLYSVKQVTVQVFCAYYIKYGTFYILHFTQDAFKDVSKDEHN